MGTSKRKAWPPWTPKPPSDTCETLMQGGEVCGGRAVLAYPAMGGGYHAMCFPHARKHLRYCVSIEEARRGRVPKLRRSPRPTNAPRPGKGA